MMKTSLFATLSLALLAAAGCTDSDGLRTTPTTSELARICAVRTDAALFDDGFCCFNQDTGEPALCTDHPTPEDLCVEEGEVEGTELQAVAVGRQIGESPALAIFEDTCEDEEEPPGPEEPPFPPPDEPPGDEGPCEDGAGYVVVGNETDRLVFTLGPITAEGERAITFYQYGEDVEPGDIVTTPDGLLPHPALDNQQVYAKVATSLYMDTPEGPVFIGHPHLQADLFPSECKAYQC